MNSVGYCTNVFSGTSLAAVIQNIERFTSELRHIPHTFPRPPLGLWLSQSVVDELSNQDGHELLQRALGQYGSPPQSLNGFPQGDFHQAVVKHSVYEPNWCQRARLEYTMRLAEILAALIDEGQFGTISTLPVAWGTPQLSAHERCQAAQHLWEYALFADKLKQQTGRTIRLCLEPEPGCVLETSRDIVTFLNDDLLPQCKSESIAREYVAICHDVCHAAVMFELQEDVVACYQLAGWKIAKVQWSSALVADFGRISDDDRARAEHALAKFAEPRYLHQSCIDGRDFFEDLPQALLQAQRRGEWRIHFHVPIFLRELADGLTTTQDAIIDCAAALRKWSNDAHWEIETYAWHVFPQSPAPDQIGRLIVQELQWFHDTIGC